MANAAVFPVPVCACAMTSLPSIINGIAASWTGVGSLNPISSIDFIIRGSIFNDPKSSFMYYHANRESDNTPNLKHLP